MKNLSVYAALLLMSTHVAYAGGGHESLDSTVFAEYWYLDETPFPTVQEEPELETFAMDSINENSGIAPEKSSSCSNQFSQCAQAAAETFCQNRDFNYARDYEVGKPQNAYRVKDFAPREEWWEPNPDLNPLSCNNEGGCKAITTVTCEKTSEKIFVNPMQNGHPIVLCEYDMSDCGDRVAQGFCQSQGFDGVNPFGIYVKSRHNLEVGAFVCKNDQW